MAWLRSLAASLKSQSGFFEEAIRLDGDFTEAKYALSKACRELGDIDGAIQMLGDVVASRRAFAEARYNLGVALSAGGKRQQDALRELLIARAIQPDAAHIRVALGQLYSERNDHERAIEELRRAVELMPSDPDAHYNLGLSLRLAGRLDDADAELRRALELNPRHGPSHKARGLVFRQRGSYAEARLELESAGLLLPVDAEVRQVLGAVLVRLGELEHASEQLRQAVKLNPVLYESWYQLSQVEQKLGRQEAARVARDEGKKAEQLKRKASESLIRYQIAEERVAKGDQGSAIAVLREAVQLSPEFVDGGFRLAELLAETNGPDAEVEALLTRVLEIRPAHARARARLGWLLLKRGQKERAVPELERALEQAPSLTFARRQLLDFAVAKEDWGSAAEHSRRLLAWDPKDSSAQRILTRALSEQKDAACGP